MHIDCNYNSHFHWDKLQRADNIDHKWAYDNHGFLPGNILIDLLDTLKFSLDIYSQNKYFHHCVIFY